MIVAGDEVVVGMRVAVPLLAAMDVDVLECMCGIVRAFDVGLAAV